jgi:hypothetical protein
MMRSNFFDGPLQKLGESSGRCLTSVEVSRPQLSPTTRLCRLLAMLDSFASRRTGQGHSALYQVCISRQQSRVLSVSVQERLERQLLRSVVSTGTSICRFVDQGLSLFRRWHIFKVTCLGPIVPFSSRSINQVLSTTLILSMAINPWSSFLRTMHRIHVDTFPPQCKSRCTTPPASGHRYKLLKPLISDDLLHAGC